MSTLDFDPEDSTTPPYEKVRLGIVDRIRQGSLLAGDKLPAIRALAQELGLSAGTAARAYKELEEAGLLTTRRGAGTRIAEGIDPSALPGESGEDPALAAYARKVVEAARERGLALDGLAAAIRDEVARTGAAD